MNRFKKIFILLFGVMACMQIQAQDKIVNPDISYAGTPRTLKIGGINVSGVEGYEDYVLTGISGLSVGDEITVPGDEITNAVKRYWKHGLFSKVAIAADSIVGEKLYLHIYLAVRPRISNINYVGLKKSEREDMEQKLGMVKGTQVTPNMLDRAKILAKKYFDDRLIVFYMILYAFSAGNIFPMKNLPKLRNPFVLTYCILLPVQRIINT